MSAEFLLFFIAATCGSIAAVQQRSLGWASVAFTAAGLAATQWPG
jgi:hypothetical protein